MNVSSALGRPFPDNPRGRFWFRVGHYGTPIMITLIVINLGLNWIPAMYGSASNGFIILPLSVWYLMTRHDHQLCERCITAMPLDGATRAAAWPRRLLLRGGHYVIVDRRGRWVAVAAIIVVALLAGIPGPHPFWVRAQAAEAPALCVLVYWLAIRAHQWLQPWCPRCRDDGGGGFHEPSPELPADRQPAA